MRKAFFSEEKNQKTLINLLDQRVRSALRARGKSFCFFFRNEALYSLETTRSSKCRSILISAGASRLSIRV